MTALALFVVFCWLSITIITVVGGLRSFRASPPSLNREENARQMTTFIHEHWGLELRALGFAQGVAAIVLAVVVLLG